MAARLCGGLARQGHVVDRVERSAPAMELAVEGDYDVIVLGLAIDPSDSFDVCRSVRAQGHWSPILLLTSGGRVDQRVEGLDAGADDCLQTPFSFEELAARLRALARRGRRGPPARRPTGNNPQPDAGAETTVRRPSD
jgi:two-component system OmpR family response regulator